MLPSAVDWSEFHVWSFLLSDVENAQRKNAQRTGDASALQQPAATDCAACRANRLPPKDRKIKVKEECRPSTVHAAYAHFAAGAIGGGTATYTTHWLDTVKVKMQSFPTEYRGGVHCLRDTMQAEGVQGLWSGAVPAVAGQMCRAAVVFMSYGFCEEAVRQMRAKASLSELNVWDHASAGAMTGVVASFVLCPMEVVKCRLQALSASFQNAKHNAASVPGEKYGAQYHKTQNHSAKFSAAGHHYHHHHHVAKQNASGHMHRHHASGNGAKHHGSFHDASHQRASQHNAKCIPGRGSFSMVHSILRTDGVTGLYRGLPGIWIKDVPGSFLYFGSYELAKSSIRRLKRNEILGSRDVFLCGMFAGLTYCVTHPIESAKTRVQVRSAMGHHKGFVASFIQIVQYEGMRPLMSGLAPSMLRACMYSGIQFLTYETVRDFLLLNLGSQ